MVTRAVCRSCLTAGRRAVLKSPPHRRGCAQSRLPKLGDSGLAEYSCITALWANIRICRQWSATAGRPLCRPTVRKRAAKNRNLAPGERRIDEQADAVKFRGHG